MLKGKGRDRFISISTCLNLPERYIAGNPLKGGVSDAIVMHVKQYRRPFYDLGIPPHKNYIYLTPQKQTSLLVVNSVPESLVI
jgi:hypothetical protein